jgi:5-formyltetrahydrofolate cyclo-ligase
MPELFNDKATVRSRFVNDRSTLGNQLLRQASAAVVRRLLDAPELEKAGNVCAYNSFDTEPDTVELIEVLESWGVRVLLPVLLPDGDLDWAVHDTRFATGRLGLREPAGGRLGPAAITTVDAVILPALAISATGQRLGRGGGSYDRALARLAGPGTSERARPWTCALVYDHELGVEFPVGPHDQPVAAACAPSRLLRFTG